MPHSEERKNKPGQGRKPNSKNKEPMKPPRTPRTGRPPKLDKPALVTVTTRVEPRYRDYFSVLALEQTQANWLREWINAKRKERGLPPL